MKKHIGLAVIGLLFVLSAPAKAIETRNISFSKREPDVVVNPAAHQEKVSSHKQNASDVNALPSASGRAILAAGTELIQDGGFENGGYPDAYGFASLSSAWSWSSSGVFSTSDPRYTSPSTNAAHTGSWCVYFDILGAKDKLYQRVTIPANDTATLSFWLKIGTLGPNDSDVFGVNFTDLNGNALNTFVKNYHDTDSVGYSYVHYSYDVSALAGQTVYLLFWTDEIGSTNFLLDDVSLIVSFNNLPPTPTPTPAPPSGYTYVLPSSAHAAGANGAFYSTDLSIANRGTTPANIGIKYVVHDADGTGTPSLNSTLPAGQSTTFTDILGTSFGVSSGYGGLIITSNSGSLKIVGQTSTPPPSGAGTFGQSVSALSTAEFATTTVGQALIALRQDAGFRTNVVLMNVSSSTAQAYLVLYSSSGTVLGVKSVSLPPQSMTQLSGVVTLMGAPSGTRDAVLMVSSATDGAQIAAYASIIDNVTNDPKTILPQ